MATARHWAYALSALVKTHGVDAVADAFVEHARTQHIEHLVPGVCEHLARIAERNARNEQLVLTSAHDMPEDALNAIRAHVGAPNTVSVSHSKNPELVGGFVAEYAGTVYDGSIARQLEKLHATLTR